MAVIGCYALDLYCDTGGDSYGMNCPRYRPGANTYPHDYSGPNERYCIAAAKRAGWTFDKEDRNKAYCPSCSKARRRK